jgi:hypothetical protein
MRLELVSGPMYMEIDYLMFIIEAPMDGETPAVMHPVLHQNYPNPFNPSTTIAYYLPAPSRVRLAIFDAAGRPVRDIVDREESCGPHDVLWDGRDRGGRRMPSGVYFYRLTSGTTTISKKMILLR